MPRYEEPDYSRSTTDRPLFDDVDAFLTPSNLLVFGAFIATSFFPKQDATTPEDTRLLNQNVIFQLAPMQDVFPVCGNHEGRPWQAYCDLRLGSGGGLSFGRALDAGDDIYVGGATLHLDETLKYGTFEYNVVAGGIYSASAALEERRGEQRIEFKVGDMEVLDAGGLVKYRLKITPQCST